MAKWYRSITTQGASMMAQAMANGDSVYITRAQCGSGLLDISGKSEDEVTGMLSEMTSISSPVKFLPIVAKSASKNSTRVRIQLSNADIESKFRLSMLAVYGRLGTETTDRIFKIYYTEEGDTIDPASVHPGYVAEYMANVTVTNGVVVNVVVDSAGMLTIGALKTYLDDYSTTVKDIGISFTQAAKRDNIESGDSLATLFGKIKKWFADLGTAAFKNVAEADGVCELDSSGKIPEGRIPDYAMYHVGTTAPINTKKLWIDTSDSKNYLLKVYYQGDWHLVNAFWG